MRVALVNPPNQVSPDLPGSPLALGYLAAYAESQGHSVDIYDFERFLLPAGDVVRQVHLEAYDLVGFSTFTHTLFRCLEIAGEVKRRRPETYILFGGHHVTPLARETLEDFAVVDGVVRYEGERALTGVADVLERGGRDFSSVPNLCWREGDVIRENPLAPLEKDLDVFPFPKREVANDWDLNRLPWFFDHNTSGGRRYLNMVSGRGCPYSCNYCAIPTTIGRTTRDRSIENVMEEVKLCQERLRFEHIFFQDPNFFVRFRRALDLARTLHAEMPDLTFSFETRSDQICRHRDVIREMARNGCLAITMGIESASPAVLKRLNKGASAEENEKAIFILREAGIRPQLYLIMFDAESTLEDLRLNLAFMKRCGLMGFLPHQYILYDHLQPLPGTEYWEIYRQRFGIADRHRIPEPFFLEPAVEAVWNAVDRFRKKYDPQVSGQLDEIHRYRSLILRRGETTLSVATSRALQALLLAAIELRFLPYNIFEEALERAGCGELPNLDWMEKNSRHPVVRAIPQVIARNRRLFDALRQQVPLKSRGIPALEGFVQAQAH